MSSEQTSSPSAEFPAARSGNDALRFGMRALMAVTAICGVQFALMNYLGVLQGLIAGMVASLVLLSGVMMAGLIWGRSESAEARFDRLVIRLTLAATVLFIGTIIAGGGVGVMYFLRTAAIARALHLDLGFDHRTDYIYDGKRGREAILITAIEAGGLFEQADIHEGDAILSELPPAEYLEMLDRNRGNSVTITVVSATPSRAIQGAPQRSVEIVIPP